LRFNSSDLPFWFRLLPLDRQDELHHTLTEMVTKKPGMSNDEEIVAYAQSRFQLRRAHILDLINHYRFEPSPLFAGDEYVTTHNDSPFSTGQSALHRKQKISSPVTRRSSISSFAKSPRRVSMKWTPVASPLSDGRTRQRHSVDSVDTFISSNRKHRGDSDFSVIGELEVNEGPESPRQLGELRNHYTNMMMAAKTRNNFAEANIYQQYVIKLQLRLSETKNRKDTLTKLWNRYAFDEDIPIFELMCKDTSEERGDELKGVIIAIDLTNFKHLNDQLGHKQGDRALRRYAYALRKVARDIACITGNFWNVYRVGGDEFCIIGRTNCHKVFQKVCYMCGAIKIPWTRLVPDCTTNAYIFGRVGGVYGRQVRYEDADTIERWLKDKIKIDRNSIAQPHEIQTVTMYYVDKSDRDIVIREQEKAIEDAMVRRDFKRCSELQEYIKFLREGFNKLQNEKNANSGDDEDYTTPTKNSNESDCVKRNSKSLNLGDLLSESPLTYEKKCVTVSLNDVSPNDVDDMSLKKSIPLSAVAISTTEPKINSKTHENYEVKNQGSNLEIHLVPLSVPEIVGKKSEKSLIEICKSTELKVDEDGVNKHKMCVNSRPSHSHNSLSDEFSDQCLGDKELCYKNSSTNGTYGRPQNLQLDNQKSQLNTLSISPASRTCVGMELNSPNEKVDSKGLVSSKSISVLKDSGLE